jgi:hypothetical protein
VPPKVFCIGFHKTGTSSLARALEVLGYRVTGPNGVDDPDIAENVHDLARRLIEEYDAFQDNPWPILFRELDAWCPGSKFVLTVRDPDGWLRSQVRHFGKLETPMRRWIYGPDAGGPEGNEEIYRRRYEEHNEAVRKHFADRAQDLLEMDLTKGDGWEVLCPFLGHKTPRLEFPRANQAEDRERKGSRFVKRLRWWLYRKAARLSMR